MRVSNAALNNIALWFSVPFVLFYILVAGVSLWAIQGELCTAFIWHIWRYKMSSVGWLPCLHGLDSQTGTFLLLEVPELPISTTGLTASWMRRSVKWQICILCIIFYVLMSHNEVLFSCLRISCVLLRALQLPCVLFCFSLFSQPALPMVKLVCFLFIGPAPWQFGNYQVAWVWLG